MSSRPAFFDAHNHLQDAWLLTARDQVLADLAGVGVVRCVVNGTSELDWPDVATLCASAPASRNSQLRLLPSFGLHPWDVGNRSPAWKEALLQQLEHHPKAGIGEIGLDRRILDRARPDDSRLLGLRRAPLDEQMETFRWQLALAAERNLPASIHCLDAFGALLDVLRSTPLPACGFLLHAYNGSREMAVAFASLGAFFSFNGGFLDPRKQHLQDLYAHLPADRVLVETDAPAMRLPAHFERFTLPPSDESQPVNHPANLSSTYAALAELRGVDLPSLAAQVAANFTKLFGGMD